MPGAGVSTGDLAAKPRPAGFIEYNLDPGFDDPVGWTSKFRCSVADSAAVFTGLSSPVLRRIDGPEITPGSYEATGIVEGLSESGGVIVYVGGNISTPVVTNGPFTTTVTCQAFNQARGLHGFTGTVGRVTKLSIRKVA